MNCTHSVPGLSLSELSYTCRARNIATDEGWSQRDMLQTQTFGKMYRTSTDLAAPLRMEGESSFWFLVSSLN